MEKGGAWDSAVFAGNSVLSVYKVVTLFVYFCCYDYDSTVDWLFISFKGTV